MDNSNKDNFSIEKIVLESKEKLFNTTKESYVARNGIKIKKTFNENGTDINEAFSSYLERCLESRD